MDGRQMGGFQGLGENGKYEWVGVSSGGVMKMFWKFRDGCTLFANVFNATGLFPLNG